jgi:hypothetical protein
MPFGGTLLLCMQMDKRRCVLATPVACVCTLTPPMPVLSLMRDVAAVMLGSRKIVREHIPVHVFELLRT